MTIDDGSQHLEIRQFGGDTCFLCLDDLTDETRTAEHVIPKWVQNQFALWNDTVSLMNGTAIPYRQLTVPCCFKCNNEHLQPLESEVRDAVQNGADAVGRLSNEVLFLWLGKIFFGLLFKETLLPKDRRDPDGGNIVSKEFLAQFIVHHIFLQHARFHIMEMFPASIFIYQIKESGDPGGGFDLMDNPSAMTIALRLGKVGIMAALQDSQAMRIGFEEDFVKYRPLKLQPIQFAEIMARLTYKVHLMEKAPFHVVASPPHEFTVHQDLYRPSFGEWENEEFALLFAAMSRQPIEKVYSHPDMLTFLDDPEGRPRDLQ